MPLIPCGAEGQSAVMSKSLFTAPLPVSLSQMEKLSEVDLAIEGLSPSLRLSKSTSHNPDVQRLVHVITEIYDRLSRRLLYARVGTPYCPEHDLPMVANVFLRNGRCGKKPWKVPRNLSRVVSPLLFVGA